MSQTPLSQTGKPRGPTRRRFLKIMGGGILGAGALGAYIRLVEPEWLETLEVEVPVSAEPAAPIRILQISDLHLGEFVGLPYLRRACDMGLALKPDLICLTGDIVNARDHRAEDVTALLATLARNAPTYVCLGNHDGGHWSGRWNGYGDTKALRAMIAPSGAKLLDNTSEILEVRGRKMAVLGFGDAWAGEFHPGKAFAPLRGRERLPTVALVHNPDSKELLQGFAWDLLLCGHTHGGQCKLPLIGRPFASVRDTRFVQGLHRWENRWLHVTKGVGNLHGVRFNCRPDITLLHLK